MGDQMVKQEPRQPPPPRLDQNMHRLDFGVAAVDPLERAHADRTAILADHEEVDAGARQCVGRKHVNAVRRGFGMHVGGVAFVQEREFGRRRVGAADDRQAHCIVASADMSVPFTSTLPSAVISMSQTKRPTPAGFAIPRNIMTPGTAPDRTSSGAAFNASSVASMPVAATITFPSGKRPGPASKPPS